MDKKRKISIYKYDILEYIAASLSPASVLSVETNESLRASRVVVPDNQLSLAIGRGGQNVRLASRLTGWKIDIKPESEAMKSLSKEAEDRLEELAKQNEITDFSDFEDIE